MNVLYEAAKEICGFMAARDWPYCIIGGLAVQQWGEPRTTLVADLMLLTGWGEEEKYVTALLEQFESRIADGHDFALSRRILLLRSTNRTDIDVALGALPFEESMIARAKESEFAPGINLPCCSAEDLFVMKAFASRPRDWLDAESIVRRQSKFDALYMLEQLTELCALKEAPEILERAKQIIEARQ